MLAFYANSFPEASAFNTINPLPTILNLTMLILWEIFLSCEVMQYDKYFVSVNSKLPQNVRKTLQKFISEYFFF